jgi:hypothetical protein
MSEVKVNKISPRSGTNVQLGDSGDTITVPSGATLDASNATTTLPANVVTTTGSQTLTNKIIGSSQLTGALPALDGSALTGIPDTIAPTRHSIRPSLNLDFANSKVLDPRITFTRASNATYYDGYTSVKAEENLYSYSQEFDNAYWTKFNTTATADDIVAPDGTTTAERITVNNTVGAYINRGSIMQNGEEYTLSIYAKAGTADNIRISNITSGTTGGWFDLSTGTIGTQNGASNSSTITDVGNGWYRITRTFGSVTANSSTESLFGINDGDGLTTAPLNGYLYVWGAQIEKRSSATAYTPTTSSPITKYQPALQTAGNNVARFDHNPTTGESLGLLIEESRTNLNTFSAPTSAATATTFTNSAIAPDGTLTASEIKDNGTSTVYVPSTAISFTAGNTYTFSYYAKLGSYTGIVGSLIYGNYFGGSNLSAYFDLSTGTVSGTPSAGLVGYGITDVGNGWYRIHLTATCVTSGSQSQQIIRLGGGQANKTFYAWGLQVEAGSFPTSYIKTTGSQVTRSVDNASMTGTNFSDWYNAQKSTLYLEASYQPKNNYQVLAHIGDGTLFNEFYVQVNLDNYLRFTMRNPASVNTFDTTFSTDKSNTFVKSLFTLERDNAAVIYTGETIRTDNTIQMPIANQFSIGFRPSANQQASAHYKKIAYYPLRLTDNEITDLSEE